MAIACALTLLFGVGPAAPAAAQMDMIEDLATTTPEQRADFLTETMTAELELDAKQVPEVRALNLEYAKLQQPLLDGDGGTLSRALKMRKLNSEKETRLRGLLTDAQWSVYEDGRSQLRDEMADWAEAPPEPEPDDAKPSTMPGS